jgi:hypothetical protein
MTRMLATLAVLWLALASAAHAQGVTLNPYVSPFTAKDGLALQRPTALGHHSLQSSLTLDYARNPLVVELRQGNASTQNASPVSDQLTGQLRVTFDIHDRLLLMVGLDVVMMMRGDRFFDPGAGRTKLADGGGLGDARIGARYLLLGGDRAVGAIAVQGQLIFPLAKAASSSQNLTGESNVSFAPELLGELRPGPVRITLNVGALVREPRTFLRTEIGSQLTYGLGASYSLPGRARWLQVLAELYGRTTFESFFGRETTPFELLMGARADVRNGWRAMLAAGPGLTRGLGTPDARVLAGVSFLAPHLGDRDADGVSDRHDRCPGDAEDQDDYEDDDGCAEPDNDADGVQDRVDSCPLDAEDADKFDDYDGCPEPDNDHDGFDDGADRCPLEPEDHDGFEDEDGCPDDA